MLTLGYLFIHAHFEKRHHCAVNPSFGWPCTRATRGPLWSIVRRSEWMEAHHFASLSADSGETTHDGLVKTIGLYRREVSNCVAGIAVARGPRCGQPFSACHYWWQKDVSKGVKWDRTAVNAGAQAWNMIRPLSWIEVLSCQNCARERERDGGRERLWVALLSCLVTHTLDNAGSVSFPLWLKHSLMHILDAWTFAPGPHALQREREKKKKDLCVPNHDIRTALGKSCPLFEFVQLLRNETQTYMMWLVAFLRVKVQPRMEDSAVIYSNDSIQLIQVSRSQTDFKKMLCTLFFLKSKSLFLWRLKSEVGAWGWLSAFGLNNKYYGTRRML